jgi:MFS family permease
LNRAGPIILWAIVFATPFFIFWGWLSDKIGRKWIMMAGMGLAIFTYRPIFSVFLNDTNTSDPPGVKVDYLGLEHTSITKELNNKGDSISIYTEKNAKNGSVTLI